MKLLIVKLHALGDLIIVTPAIRRMKDAFRDAELHLVTTSWAEPAIRHHPLIDNVIIVPTDVFFKKSLSSVKAQLKLVSKLKRQKYDALLIFHRHKFLRGLFRLTGIPKQFGFTSGPRESGGVYLDEDRHSIETAFDLAELAAQELGGGKKKSLDYSTLRYEWYCSDSEIESASTILKNLNIPQEGFVAMFPGGGNNPSDDGSERRWSPEGFKEVVRSVDYKYGMRTVLCGAKTDSNICAGIANGMEDVVVDISAKHDLRITAAITRSAVLSISNDSAPLHMSAAVGTPLIGIFGPTGAKYKLPPGPDCYEASTGIECSPCYFTSFKGCIHDEFKCMTQLNADVVMSKVDEIMDSRQKTEVIN